MDRRKALINLGILTGGIVLLPSCEFSKEKISFALNNLKVTEDQQSLLKEIVETMIPEGNIPGANSLQVDDFVWVMVDDCLDQTRQTSFLNGLNQFNEQIEKFSGITFTAQNTEQRIESFQNILKDPDKQSSKINDDVKSFLRDAKDFTILGYMNSEYIMTEIMPYSLVPTKYGTCETIDNSKRINVNG